MRRPTSRQAGWLPERTIRSGLREQWATNSGPDSLSVTLGYSDGAFVVRAVRISNDGRQVVTTTADDIEIARNIFTNRVEMLCKGRHAELFD